MVLITDEKLCKDVLKWSESLHVNTFNTAWTWIDDFEESYTEVTA